MNKLVLVLSLLIVFQTSKAQKVRAELSVEEVEFVQSTFNDIKKSDQLYRPILSAGTLDPTKLAKLDSLYKGDDVLAVFEYKKSIPDELTKPQRDSLSKLQRQLDFTNHMIMRGIWDRYGWISKEVIEENNFVQILHLLHPPLEKNQIPEYTENYKAKLLPEVKAGRMPAKTYASFIDNMLGKILREPQLYGTNGQFNPETNEILPPMIKDLSESNTARKALGLPPLKEGEYRIASLN